METEEDQRSFHPSRLSNLLWGYPRFRKVFKHSQVFIPESQRRAWSRTERTLGSAPHSQAPSCAEWFPSAGSRLPLRATSPYPRSDHVSFETVLARGDPSIDASWETRRFCELESRHLLLPPARRGPGEAGGRARGPRCSQDFPFRGKSRSLKVSTIIQMEVLDSRPVWVQSSKYLQQFGYFEAKAQDESSDREGSLSAIIQLFVCFQRSLH